MSLLNSIQLLQHLYEASVSKFFDSDEYIIYKFNDRSKIEREYHVTEFGFEFIGENEISLDIFSINGLFYNKEHFIKYCSSKVNGLRDSDIGILFFEENNYLLYDSTLKKSSVGFQQCDSNHFIQNAICYLEFIEKFESSELITYHDDARREFVVISPENGKLQIGYPLSLPNIPDELILANHLDVFCKRNKTPEFQVFFREQLIASLSSANKEERFPQLTYDIINIIESSERNYETYLNKFSFEELKKNFRKERDEYFVSIREILSKLLDKIVSIPISISAAALAIYNLKSEPTYVAIVTIAFIIYSIFACYLLRLLQNDVWEIKISLDNDLEIIKKSSNIPADMLLYEGNKVYVKLNRLHIVILVFQGLFLILSCLVLIISFLICYTTEAGRFLSVSAVVIVHILVATYKINHNIKKHNKINDDPAKKRD